MKDMKVLSRNDLYLVTRLAKAASDLAERCGVSNGGFKPVRARRRKAKAKAQPVTKPAARVPTPPRPAVPRRTFAEPEDV